jgi:hypothetical protein
MHRPDRRDDDETAGRLAGPLPGAAGHALPSRGLDAKASRAYIRFKLALTEEQPNLKTYEEADWAKLADVRETPIEVSVDLLDALHRRWVVALGLLTEKDFARTARHPVWGSITVDFLLAQYAWHGRHHVAHITSLRERMGWS